MPKLIWEKKLQEAEKPQKRFGCWVSARSGKVLVYKNYPDTKKTIVDFLIA